MMRLALLLVLALIAVPAAASEWGGIEPGVSSVDQVRGRYGQPSKETRPKVEGYDTLQWVYEGAQAPEGVTRMTVDFGLLVAGAYKPNLVRLLTLEPKPAIFGKHTVIQGWGVPDAVADNKDGSSTLIWKDGLLATFAKEGNDAVSMIFSVPQPLTPSAPPPAPKK
jgi:hypothetical protein